MDKQRLLNELKEKMEMDNTLPLKKEDTNLVFGVGDPDTNILMIGEGPGYHENRLKEPFVGNAGALLDQLLSYIKLPRESIYITNVVHHRPPENRDPMPTEIAAYEKYLDEIINIIKPKVVVTLGRYSMGKFLPGVFISSVHGKPKVVEFGGRKITIVPMYHPAAALRNGEVKEKLKRDFEKLPQLLADSGKNDDKIGRGSTQMNLI